MKCAGVAPGTAHHAIDGSGEFLVGQAGGERLLDRPRGRRIIPAAGTRTSYTGQVGHEVGNRDVRAGDGIELVGDIGFDGIALGGSTGRSGVGICDCIVITEGHHTLRGRSGIGNADNAGADANVRTDLDTAEHGCTGGRQGIAVGAIVLSRRLYAR